MGHESPPAGRHPLEQDTDRQESATFLQQGWLNCNVVLIRGTPNVLIDTGYVADAGALEAMLWGAAGITFEDIGLVVITHPHPDHIGAAAAIRARSHADIAADEETAGIVSCWDTRLLWSSYSDLQVAPFPVTRVLKDGERLDLGSTAMRTVYAPGHSRAGACFWLEDQRTLVSSDVVRDGSFGALNPRVDGDDVVTRHLATLEKLEALAPRLVWPAHGPAIVEVARNFDALRRRTTYLANHPDKLASHLMKVLLLVHMLDRTSMRADDVRRYIPTAPWFADYLPYLAPLSAGEAVDALLEDLLANGALRQVDDRLVPTMAR